MSHHLSPSLSHYTKAAHACFAVCVFISSFAHWLFILLLFNNFNLFHDKVILSWPCKTRVLDLMSFCLASECVCWWFLCDWEVPSVMVAVDVHTQRKHYCTTAAHTHTHTTSRLRLSYCVCTQQHVYVFQATLTGYIDIPVSLRAPLCILWALKPLSLSLSLCLSLYTEHQTYHITLSASEHSKSTHT